MRNVRWNKNLKKQKIKTRICSWNIGPLKEKKREIGKTRNRLNRVMENLSCYKIVIIFERPKKTKPLDENAQKKKHRQEKILQLSWLERKETSESGEKRRKIRSPKI